MLRIVKIYSSLVLMAAFSLQIKAQEKDSTAIKEVNLLNENYRSFINSEPILAISYAQEALTLAREIAYPRGEAAALNNIGVFYKQRGNIKRALEYYQQALRINDSISNEEGKAFTLSNIGTIFSITGDYTRAYNNYQQALQIFEAQGDQLRILGLLNNIGNVFKAQGNIAEALKKYEDAQVLFERIPEKERQFEPYTNIGNIYFSNKEYSVALTYYMNSLAYERSKNDLTGIASAENNIAITYNKLGNQKEALEYALNALEIAKSIDAKPIEQNVYSTLSDIYYEAGQLKNAFDYLKMHYNLKDSLLSEDNLQAIRDIELVFELENQTKEIELLRKESEIKDLSIRNSRLTIIAIIIIIILLLAVVVLILLKYAENKRAQTILHQQNQEIIKRKRELEAQKRIVEDKNQSMTDSIQYAKSVQDSILNKEQIIAAFPRFFIFFKPKDIVSGDFYWYQKIGSEEILAVLDCTGHGVAGAFMTVIANSLLNQVVITEKNTDPATILSKLDEKVMETLRQRQMTISNHGMDVAILKIDSTNNKATFAGAKRPLIYFKDKMLKLIKGDKFSVGETNDQVRKEFSNHALDLTEIDSIYLFTDGFSDQFGAEINKKYMIKRFKLLLEKIQSQSMAQQGNSLDLEMKRWMGEMEQTDDMLVLGIGIR